LASILRPSWPSLDVSEECVSRASSSDVLSVSHESVGGGETSPISRANDEGLCSVEGSCWRKGGHEISHEAETDGTGVEAWRVSTGAIPATSFIDLSVVSDAEVVTDVSPSVGVHVKILDATHFSIATSLGGATSSSGVVNDKVGWWLGGQPRWVSSASSPLGSCANVSARSGLCVGTDGQGGDEQCNEKFHG
jgi:hypothetical protein